MAGRLQSLRMSFPARSLVGVVVLAGMGVLAYGAAFPNSHNIAEFTCYLLIALLVSQLKVELPEITDTMSVNFLFVLIGILELSFSETVMLGSVAVLMQSFQFHRDRPRPIRVSFNICASACSIALAYAVFHLQRFHGTVQNQPLLLLLAASTYFLANTGSVALGTALIERKSIRQIWVQCYSWAFPYYLVGAAIAGLINWLNHSYQWEASLLVFRWFTCCTAPTASISAKSRTRSCTWKRWRISICAPSRRWLWPSKPKTIPPTITCSGYGFMPSKWLRK